MAVEAHHLLHNMGGPQKTLVAAHAGWEGGRGLCYEPAPTTMAQVSVPARHAGYYGGAAAGRQGPLQHHGYHQQLPPPSCATMVAGQAAASESGVTFGGAQAQEAVSRKRKRADQPQFQLGLAVAAHLQQELLDVDRIVHQHTAKMSADLTERRRSHARQFLAAAEAAAARRLRAKEEELARAARLNCALEERVRSLSVEAQVWRDLAQSNEAAAAALRAELQHALDAQARRGLVAAPAEGGGGADDAASCCCGENDVAAGEDEAGTSTVRRCVVCGEGRAEVLLLPCRHLCACAACAGAATACPACGCAKNGSVCVNFS